MDHEHEFDVAVIGAGYGGVTAGRPAGRRRPPGGARRQDAPGRRQDPDARPQGLPLRDVRRRRHPGRSTPASTSWPTPSASATRSTCMVPEGDKAAVHYRPADGEWRTHAQPAAPDAAPTAEIENLRHVFGATDADLDALADFYMTMVGLSDDDIAALDEVGMADYMTARSACPRAWPARSTPPSTCCSSCRSTGWRRPRPCSCCATWSSAAPGGSTGAATARWRRRAPRSWSSAAACSCPARGCVEVVVEGGRAVGDRDRQGDDPGARPSCPTPASSRPCSRWPGPSGSPPTTSSGSGPRTELGHRRVPLRVRHPGVRRRPHPRVLRPELARLRPLRPRWRQASGPTCRSSRSTSPPSSTPASWPSRGTRWRTSRSSCRPTPTPTMGDEAVRRARPSSTSCTPRCGPTRSAPSRTAPARSRG